MKYAYGKLAGGLLFVGGTQFVVGMVVAEALYPGYSVSQNYISDLGVGPSAVIFNSSVVLLGLLAVVGAYFVQRAFRSRVLAALFSLAGIGAIGVGIFPENFGMIHRVVSLIAFLFGGLSAIAAYRLERRPLSYFSVILGVTALVAITLYYPRLFFSLGPGGMERMIAYPILLWVIGFGGYLMSSPEITEPKASK